MPKLLMWNLSCLKQKSRPLTGPLPEMYVREISRLCEELQGVFISGIQIGDARRFAIPNPRFKDFPILYNPVIVDQYDLIPSEGEGCLSFPGLWVQVPRYKYITVRYRDGQWQERTATFGDDDPNTEAGLCAKAIQHEIFHMDGIVTHERIKDAGKRIKVQAQILKASLDQNKKTGIPKLIDGPVELDPNSLPIPAAPVEEVLVDEVPGIPSTDEGTDEAPVEVICVTCNETGGVTTPEVLGTETQEGPSGQSDIAIVTASDGSTKSES